MLTYKADIMSSGVATLTRICGGLGNTQNLMRLYCNSRLTRVICSLLILCVCLVLGVCVCLPGWSSNSPVILTVALCLVCTHLNDPGITTAFSVA